MALGKMPKEFQKELFLTADVARTSGHPFYKALGKLLSRNHFDDFAEDICRKFYAEKMGRPGLHPGVYFRMLIIGYLEGWGSEREIAWRCQDSLSMRDFLGFRLTGRTPDHSTLSKTRKRLDVEAHTEVFTWVLKLLRESGLLKGKTVGVDSTTLDANAAMRTIRRRDSGEEYTGWLMELARESGIEEPTRADIAELDRKRPKTASNKDWVHPHDPEARVTKMKDGRTHLAHKLEVGVDMESGAVVAATVQTMDGRDNASMPETVGETKRRLEEVGVSVEEVVADKGYHSNATMVGLKREGLRSYVSEPNRGASQVEGQGGGEDGGTRESAADRG